MSGCVEEKWQKRGIEKKEDGGAKLPSQACVATFLIGLF